MIEINPQFKSNNHNKTKQNKTVCIYMHTVLFCLVCFWEMLRKKLTAMETNSYLEMYSRVVGYLESQYGRL